MSPFTQIFLRIFIINSDVGFLIQRHKREFRLDLHFYTSVISMEITRKFSNASIDLNAQMRLCSVIKSCIYNTISRRIKKCLYLNKFVHSRYVCICAYILHIQGVPKFFAKLSCVDRAD